MSLPYLPDMTPEELINFAIQIGEKPYRGKQLAIWLFRKGIYDFSVMTDISQRSKTLISQKALLHPPMSLVKIIESPDGTKRLLFKTKGERENFKENFPTSPQDSFQDSPQDSFQDQYVESVVIPEEDHLTLCLSSQVGCAMACAFCRTGSLGFKRNLSQAEMLFQITEAKRTLKGDKKITNLVFMGMGEPLLNMENLLKALRIITDPEHMAFPSGKTTVSTMGIASGIKTLGESSNANLALSLNAADEELRKKLMPKGAHLSELKEALKAFPLRRGKRVTLAYVLLKDINDGPKNAKDLISFVHGLKVKVNLIPFNPWPGAPFERPDPEIVEKFRLALLEKNITAVTRKSAGTDINAACGQLAGESSER